MRTALETLLTNDATLTALLTGGIYTRSEISRQNTPAAFDSDLELLPCCKLTLANETPLPPFDNTFLLAFQTFLYEREGFASITLAADRLYVLLHRQRVVPSQGTCWDIRLDSRIDDTADSTLDAAMVVMRFVARIGK